MNFDLSEEQTLLKDSISKYIQTEYDFDTRRAIADSELGYSPERWQSFAELGWLAIPFDEEHGGMGGGLADAAAAMEEFGKGLLVEPYFPTVLLFGGLLKLVGSEQQKNDLIPQIVSGELLGAFAYTERQSRFELHDVATKAVDGKLSGEKVVVMGGAHANKFIVSARDSCEQTDKTGISLYLVDADAPGLTRHEFQLMDGQRVANIVMANVSGELIGEAGAAYKTIERIMRDGCVALSAEALGIMQKLNSETVNYTKTRKQFGVAIGSFQALQHRMVDTFMAYEQTKSMLFRVLCELERGPSDELDRNIHALKVLVARHGKLIGDEAIQLHGGMGMTDELNIGHFVKRLLMINTIFGNGDWHQQRFNELSYAA